MPSCKPNANQAFDSSKTNLQVQVVCTFFSISMDNWKVLQTFPKGMSLESFLVSLAMVICLSTSYLP
jgi:hypothetical protein